MTRELAAKNVNPQIHELLDGEFTLPKSTIIYADTVYDSEIWSFFDPDNLRLNKYSKGELTLDWKTLKAKHNASDYLIEELKIYAFWRLTNSKIVFSSTKKNAHPSVVVGDIREFLKLIRRISDIYHFREKLYIDSVSEIQLEDLKLALTETSLKNYKLRNILENFASNTLNKYFKIGTIKWSKQDITSMHWQRRIPESYKHLPEKLFRLLSNQATMDVKQFLSALRMKIYDKTPIGSNKAGYISRLPNFKNFFEEYVTYYGYSNPLRQSSKYGDWLKRNGGKVKELSLIIDRARIAAQIIIMIYTGARYSEFTSFTVGCLQRKNDGWIINGTVIKNEDLNAPIGKDEWIAIPIVVDAIHVLEQTARPLKTSYLFHVSHSMSSNKPPSGSHLSTRIQNYLDSIDEKKEWRNITLNTHRFRNSLAYELRKIKLGITAITYQLKHAHNQLLGTNNTTLGYGGIASDAVENAVTNANLTYLTDIYHPDSPVAGGGAEQLKKRRAAYFEGRATRNIDVESELLILAKQGIASLIDVGAGYCQGKAKIMINGVETDPPCIGGLKCNPVRCANGIIPKHKSTIWEKIATENTERAKQPEYAYARSALESAAEEARGVVNFFKKIDLEN
jgi:integrase